MTADISASPEGSIPADAIGRSVHPPLQWAIAMIGRSLLVVLPFSLPLLMVGGSPPDRLLTTVMVHLTVVVIVGLLLTLVLLRRVHQPWLEVASPIAERIGTGATAVVLVSGATALITLASSAALRLAPSLQFLQLLSALDIAWVTAATTIGTGWLAGRRLGVSAGAGMAAVCIWSIWAYLNTVGFTADGGWLVDGEALRRYVLPFDVAAATISISVLVMGARRDALRRQRS